MGKRIQQVNQLIKDFVAKIDSRVKSLLEEAEILDLNINSANSYDYALDTTAFFRDHPPRIGVVEVTRTGIHRWKSRFYKNVQM